MHKKKATQFHEERPQYEAHRTRHASLTCLYAPSSRNALHLLQSQLHAPKEYPKPLKTTSLLHPTIELQRKKGYTRTLHSLSHQLNPINLGCHDIYTKAWGNWGAANTCLRCVGLLRGWWFWGEYMVSEMRGFICRRGSTGEYG
jgi:hypothetical protein